MKQKKYKIVNKFKDAYTGELYTVDHEPISFDEERVESLRALEKTVGYPLIEEVVDDESNVDSSTENNTDESNATDNIDENSDDESNVDSSTENNTDESNTTDNIDENSDDESNVDNSTGNNTVRKNGKKKGKQ